MKDIEEARAEADQRKAEARQAKSKEQSERTKKAEEIERAKKDAVETREKKKAQELEQVYACPTNNASLNLDSIIYHPSSIIHHQHVYLLLINPLSM